MPTWQAVGKRLGPWCSVLMVKKTSRERFTKLRKRMDLVDVTFLGLGTGLLGFHTFTDSDLSLGPGVLLSHLLASLACFLSALCYAELACRCTGSGAAYSALYQHVGQLPAVLIGWLTVIQSLSRCALVISYTHTYVHNQLIGEFEELVWRYTSLNLSHIAWAFSLLSPMINIIFGLGTIMFARYVTPVYNNFVLYSIFLIILILVRTGTIIDLKNWQLPEKMFCGTRDFLPFVFSRIMESLGNVFPFLTGFDVVAHAAGESINPERVLPIAMIVVIGSLSMIYTLQAATFSLTFDYCQPFLFETTAAARMKEHGFLLLSWIITFSTPFVVVFSAIGSTYQLSRILYAMAEDGHLFSWLSTVKSKSPISSVAAAVLLPSVLVVILDGDGLKEIISLTSLIMYTIVASVVLFLRKTEESLEEAEPKPFWELLCNWKPVSLKPNRSTSRLVAICCVLILILPYLFLSLIYSYGGTVFRDGKELAFIILFLIPIIVIYFTVKSQPESKYSQAFKVWPYPLIPIMCIVVNSFISINLNLLSWWRAALFAFVPPIYFMYLINKSKARMFVETL